MFPRLRVVGVLESCFREKFGTPRQPQLVPESTARLALARDLLPEHSLDGLEKFSHVWLVSYLHLNTNKTFRPKIHPPRLAGKTVGLFASRSPHRPSALGLSLARLVKIADGALYLSGVDLVDGTPILDVKPYIPEYDRAARASSGWLKGVRERPFSVTFSRAAAASLGRPGGAALKRLIARTLRNDPRNPRDRSQMRPGKLLELFLHDRAVCFRVAGRTARVEEVARAGPAPSRRGRGAAPSL